MTEGFIQPRVVVKQARLAGLGGGDGSFGGGDGEGRGGGYDDTAQRDRGRRQDPHGRLEKYTPEPPAHDGREQGGTPWVGPRDINDPNRWGQ